MPTKDKIKVICFDFDGTIAATMAYLADLAVDVLTKHCRLSPEHAREQYIRTTGLPFEEQAKQICGSRDAAVAIAVTEFENRKSASYFKILPEANAGETIAGLQQRGFPVTISSSTRQELIQDYLIHYGLAPDMVLGLRTDFKKGRDHFGHICNAYQVQSGAICFVADSIYDYHVAVANGVDFIAKCGLFDYKDFKSLDTDLVVIADLPELLSIF